MTLKYTAIVTIVVLLSFMTTLLAIGIKKKHVKDGLNQQIQQLYADISDGYCISDKERVAINATGGSETYGEITFEGIERLMKELAPTTNDVFYDFGSGIGKMVIQVFLSTPVRKAIGIEMGTARHQCAQEAYKGLTATCKIPRDSIIAFIEGDFLKIDSSDATIIYIASTCFSESFMLQLIDKLKNYQKGLRFITLSSLPANDHFELIKAMHLPMTWCEKNNVYIYRLK